MDKWHGKPYYSLDAYCKNTYRRKLYKIALNAQMTCPNRDGLLDTRGCLFCSAGGSGEFASDILPGDLSFSEDNSNGIRKQLAEGISRFGNKNTGDGFIAYFQAYTNTYGPIPYLNLLYHAALDTENVHGISIATRPDCLGAPVLGLLTELKRDYPDRFIWIELGLQTIHEQTAKYIRRGYPLKVFEKAFRELSDIGIPVIVHVILGLPGEDLPMQLETIKYLSRLQPFGVKLQLLHVLKGTDLEKEYLSGKVYIPTKEEYLDTLILCIENLHPDIVIHRVTGDGRGSDLIAPDWSRNKKDVLNSLHHLLKLRGARQGDRLKIPERNTP